MQLNDATDLERRIYEQCLAVEEMPASPEQSALSATLSEAGNELQALRRRLEEYQQLKPSTIAIADHHRAQFGNVPIEMVSTNLAEEVGELCGAIIRHVEQRDGRGWEQEIVGEVRDAITPLVIICSRLGNCFWHEADKAANEFLAREWPNVTKVDRLDSSP